MLIEIHGNAHDPLLERFSRTHAVQTLVASARSATDYPELASMGDDAPVVLGNFNLSEIIRFAEVLTG